MLLSKRQLPDPKRTRPATVEGWMRSLSVNAMEAFIA